VLPLIMHFILGYVEDTSHKQEVDIKRQTEALDSVLFLVSVVSFLTGKVKY